MQPPRLLLVRSSNQLRVPTAREKVREELCLPTLLPEPVSRAFSNDGRHLHDGIPAADDEAMCWLYHQVVAHGYSLFRLPDGALR